MCKMFIDALSINYFLLELNNRWGYKFLMPDLVLLVVGDEAVEIYNRMKKEECTAVKGVLEKPNLWKIPILITQAEKKRAIRNIVKQIGSKL